MQIRKAIIPAAGLGTRLLPATKAMPKEMLPIIDKPTIQYIVEEAAQSGITDIIIVTGKGKKAIEDHFDTSLLLEQTLESKGKHDLLQEVKSLSELANIHYIRQGVPRGLGHAIWSARKFIGNEPFAVLLGDTLIKSKQPFLKQMLYHFEKKQVSIIGAKSVDDADVSKYGIIDAIQEEEQLFLIRKLIEKPSIENAPSNLAILGRYILTPKIFEILENQLPGVGNEIQLTDALEKLLTYEPIYAQILKDESFDIGEKLGYLKTNIEYALERADLRIDFLQYLRETVNKNESK